MNDAVKATVTLRDVAREAGVSVASASRALNGGERTVGRAIEERVIATAERLHYVLNTSAQNMKRGLSSSVGLVVGEIADPYFSAIASGVIMAARDKKITVTMASSERSAEHEIAAVRELRTQGHRSIIIAGSRFHGTNATGLLEQLDAFKRGGGTVVFISQESGRFPTISAANDDGARHLATQLVNLGYRSFGIVGADPLSVTAEDRIAGFCCGLADSDVSISPASIIESSLDRDGGFQAATQLLEAGRRPVDLIFALNDLAAVGAMAAVRKAGLEVGRDVGVAGFDNIDMANDVTPRLTTVSLPLAAMGEHALNLAISGTDGGGQMVHSVSATVVLRGSTPQRLR